jgi:hypothetical protein
MELRHLRYFVALAEGLSFTKAAAKRHPLVSKRQVKLGELETMFFVGMSEKMHPSFRNWLNGTCQQAGFTRGFCRMPSWNPL